ncbi:hypothetical protein NP233_g1791 [Leucocoprinus birnbaumii]|uniref:Uncharacterized protein n=1 Tax=Leucocoprinus birnbaumii TaxID=56174 RepID=A0AAD5W2I0_9AGAR|nr:hypothetical protein NP233_g1791 [Leucocoprinus birnbaumii]
MPNVRWPLSLQGYGRLAVPSRFKTTPTTPFTPLRVANIDKSEDSELLNANINRVYVIPYLKTQFGAASRHALPHLPVGMLKLGSMSRGPPAPSRPILPPGLSIPEAEKPTGKFCPPLKQL